MTETIAVGCKTPNGIFLDLISTNGERDRFATLKGCSFKRSVEGEQFNPHAMTGGFALTLGVDKAKFMQWLKANKDSALLKDGLIIYREEDLESEAREKADTKEMFAPLGEKEIKAAGVEKMSEAA